MLTLSRHEESRAAADSASNAGLGHNRRRRPGRPRRNERRNSDQHQHQGSQQQQQLQLTHAPYAQPSHTHAAGAGDLHDLLDLDASDAAAAAAASLLLNEVFQTEMSPPSSSALRALYAGLEEEDRTLEGMGSGCESHDGVEDLGFFLGFLDDGGGTSDDDEYLWGAVDEALDLDALEPTMLNDGSFVLINAENPGGEVRQGGCVGASARTGSDATAALDSAPATLNVRHHAATAAADDDDDDGRHPPDVPPLATSILPAQRQHPRPVSPQSVAQRAVRLASGKNRGPHGSSVSSGGKTGWIPPLASLSDSGSEAEPPAISDAGPSVPPSPAIKPGVPAPHLVTASALHRAAGALTGAGTRVSLALDAELEDAAFAMPSSVRASLRWEQDADADVDVDLVLLAADDSDVELDLDGTQDGCELARLSPNWSEPGEPSLFIHRRPSHARLLPSAVDIAGSATTLEDLQETLLSALGSDVEVSQRRFLVFEDPGAASDAGELGHAVPEDAAFAVAITHPLQLVPGALRDDGTEVAALKDTTDGPKAPVLDRALNANARNGGAFSWLHERDNRMAACASPPPPLLCVRCPVGSTRAGDGYLRFRPEARLPAGADALVRSLWTRRPLRSEAAASSAAAHDAASAGALHTEGAFCKEEMRRRKRSERSKWWARCNVAEFTSESSSDDDNDDDEDSDDCESSPSQGDALSGSYLVGIFDSEDDSSDPELVTFYALSHVRRKRRHRGGPRRVRQIDEDGDLSKPDAKRAKQVATAAAAASGAASASAAGPSAAGQTPSISTHAGALLAKVDGAGGSSAAAAAAAAALAGQATPVTPLQKRAMHNVLERKRREDLRASYRALRSSIPELSSNERASASVILHAASAYIAKLKQEDAYIVAQLRQLRGPAAAPTPTASETYGAYASSHGRDGMTPTPRAQATPPATYSRVQPVRFPGYT
jgi:hypothetical protein